jgi:hypothetical protein
MTIATPIGSISRPPKLIEAIRSGDGNDPALEPLYEEASRDTIACFDATGSPVIGDGEQREYHNCWTYCVQGLAIPGYPREAFIDDLLKEHETEVRNCLRLGAHKVQIRDAAFAKIRARVAGTQLAAEQLGVA